MDTQILAPAVDPKRQLTQLWNHISSISWYKF